MNSLLQLFMIPDIFTDVILLLSHEFINCEIILVFWSLTDSRSSSEKTRKAFISSCCLTANRYWIRRRPKALKPA